MEKRKHILLLLSIIIISIFFIACDDGKGETTTGNSPSGNARVEIGSVTPFRLPSATNQHFDVTCKVYDTSAVMVHLEIRSHANLPCNAYTDSFLVSSESVITKRIYTDSLSGCISNNSIFRIAIWANMRYQTSRDSCYYLWGNNNTLLDSINVSMERYRMSNTLPSDCDTMVRDLDKSFSPSDSNYLLVNLNFNTLSERDDTNFVYYGGGSILPGLSYYAQSINSNAKIIFARRVNFYDENSNYIETFGYSYPGGIYGKWSFVFKQNIDSISTRRNWNRHSVGNHTAVHEIARQIGAIIQGNFETFHLGYFTDKCAVHNPSSAIYNAIFTTYTARYRICSHHSTMIRVNQMHIPLDILNKGNFVNNHKPLIAGQKYYKQKYSLQMLLEKGFYKKYEPIRAKFILVNNDSEPMSLYNLFSPDLDEAAVNISSEEHHIESGNKMKIYPTILNEPRAVLNSGDTLILSMPINNWAIDTKFTTEGVSNDVYFNQVGYFKPGKYKAYFYFNSKDEERYGTALQSNPVEFTVLDLNEQDKEILKLYKEEKYNDAINKYPNNTFAEHIWSIKLRGYLIEYSENAESDYNEFLNKYPESYYLLTGIIKPYINLITQRKGSKMEALQYILNNSNSSSLKRVLSNKSFLEYIGIN